MTTADLLCAARAVKPAAAALSTAEKNRLLEAMAQALLDHADNILAANAADVEAARGVIAPVMIDRLSLARARGKHGRGHARRRRPAGPGGRAPQRDSPVQRARHPQGSRAHGRDCHYLREPPQRDGRRRRAVPEERQRLHFARRQGGHPLQYGRRRRAARGAGAVGMRPARWCI